MRSVTVSVCRRIDTWAVPDDASFSAAESPQERAFDYSRTVALSDGVFSIALTLLVLNIGVPVLAAGHHGELGHALLDRRQELISYVISFVVIGFLWTRHHQFFRSLARLNQTVVLMNLAYLGLIAFVPYPTRVLGIYGGESAGVILYASTIAVLAALAGAMRIYAQRARILTDTGARELGGGWEPFAAAAVFLVSIPIALISPEAAQLSWLALVFRASWWPWGGRTGTPGDHGNDDPG